MEDLRKSITSISDVFKARKLVIKKKPPHELSASVDLIVELVGLSKKYNYGYWLRTVKNSKQSYADVFALVKEAKTVDSKYNKGGFITNKLKGNKKQ